MQIYKFESSRSTCKRGHRGCFLHEDCAHTLNSTYGDNAIPTSEVPTKGSVCAWCGKDFEEGEAGR